MYIYIHIHTHICTCTYTCIYTYMHTHTYIQTYMSTGIHVHGNANAADWACVVGTPPITTLSPHIYHPRPLQSTISTHPPLTNPPIHELQTKPIAAISQTSTTLTPTNPRTPHICHSRIHELWAKQISAISPHIHSTTLSPRIVWRDPSPIHPKIHETINPRTQRSTNSAHPSFTNPTVHNLQKKS